MWDRNFVLWNIILFLYIFIMYVFILLNLRIKSDEHKVIVNLKYFN